MYKLCVLCCLVLLQVKSFTEPVASWSLSNVDSGWNNDSLVKMYFHHSEMQRQWAWDLLGREPFTGHERILDFGCGDGKISAELSHLVRNGKVVGVDVSKQMIHFAHICFPPITYTNLEFRSSDSLTFAEDLGSQEYDIVCSFAVFHLIADPLEVLKNLKTHLKPNGKILLLIPAGRNPLFYQAASETFIKYNLDIPWNTISDLSKPTMRTPQGCSFFLEKAGYSIDCVEWIETDNFFYDLDDLVSWMIGTVTANWKIPVSITRAFCSDVVDRMCELKPSMIDEEGRVHFSMSRIGAIARPQKNLDLQDD